MTDTNSQPSKPKKKRIKHDYVDNKKLYAVMCDYVAEYKACKEADIELPRVPEYVGDAIQKIAFNLAKRQNFSGYSYVDEMQDDAIENVLMYVHNFDPEKSKSPFSYFTKIMWWAFVRRIHREGKEAYLKQKMMINSSVMNELANMPAEELQHLDFDINTFIDTAKFEAMQEKYEPKKDKKDKKKGLENFVEDNE